MSATAPALTKSWRVGKFTATLSVSQPDPSGHRAALIEWTPHLPANLTKEELTQYRTGRNAAFQALGLSALVIEN